MWDKEVANDRWGEEVEANGEKVFEMELATMFNTQASGHYPASSRRKRAIHTSVMEWAVKFWWSLSLFSEAVENGVYDGSGEMRSTLPGWKKLMMNIPRFPEEELVCKLSRKESWFSLLTISEQKNTALMKDDVWRATKQENLVADAFDGSFSADKDFMHLSEHRRFMEGGVDQSCVSEPMTQLILQ